MFKELHVMLPMYEKVKRKIWGMDVNTLPELLNIAGYFFAGGLLLFIAVVILLLGLKYFTAERKFKKTVIGYLRTRSKFEIGEAANSIEGFYGNYVAGFVVNINPQSLNSLLDKLNEDVSNGSYENYYGTISHLDDILKKINDIKKYILNENVYAYDADMKNINEKIMDLKTNNSETMITDLRDVVRTKFIKCNSYYNGRLFEKDMRIKSLTAVKKKNKFISILQWMGWVITIWSGILTILQR